MPERWQDDLYECTGCGDLFEWWEDARDCEREHVRAEYLDENSRD